MKKIIIADARDSFLADVNTRMILDDERGINIVSTLTSTEHLHTAIQRFAPEIVAVSENLIDTQADWAYEDVCVVGYALTPAGSELFSKYSVPSYGVIPQVSQLLDKLEQGIPTAPPQIKETQAVPIPPSTPYYEPTGADEPQEEWPTKTVHQSTPLSREHLSPKGVGSDHNIKNRLALYRDTERNKQQITGLLDEDIRGPQKQTSVVTVYSAKGGVGKTTLATEIAVYLATSSHGRGYYRVCIVDYNIDFGDVQTTLDLSPDGSNMSWWAADIRERMENGELPDDISYTKREVESYLQVMKNTNLYALLAPLTHEDSMDIGEPELQIMLRSLTESGDFDYIVCDTGNNTRDSSVIALEAAEYILMVITQDITAANCNDSFINTMKKIHFATDKIRLVINNVLPSKITGVAVQEIEELFPYPCVARIRHDTDVIKANNYSQPIVYQEKHPVTQEIRKIINFLTGTDESELTVKKGFFSRRSKK